MDLLASRETSSRRLLTRSDRTAGHIHGSGRQGRHGSSGAVVARLERPPIHQCRWRLVRRCSTPHTLGEEGRAVCPAQGREVNTEAGNANPVAIREWAGTSTAKMVRPRVEAFGPAVSVANPAMPGRLMTGPTSASTIASMEVMVLRQGGLIDRDQRRIKVMTESHTALA